MVELSSIRQNTLNITVPTPNSVMYNDQTIASLVSLFLAAGAVSPLQVSKCRSVNIGVWM